MAVGIQELLILLLTGLSSLPQVFAGNLLEVFSKFLVQVAFRATLVWGL
jgi:hypothetical protein